MAGTHTHVPTADEQILPKGTGYLTDVGFTGPHHSVIGMDIEAATNRFILQIPQKYKLGEGNYRLNAVLFTINLQIDAQLKYGNATAVERISRASEPPPPQAPPVE